MRLWGTLRGNRAIARLEAAAALTALGSWTFSIALALYAYYEDGPGGVALAVAVRMLPAAVLAPLAERIAEGRRRRNVLAGAALVRLVLLEAIAVVVANEMAFGLLLALLAWRVPADVRSPRHRSLVGRLRAGVDAIARQPWMRVRLGLFGVSSLVQSMLELLIVVAALDLVGVGSSGVGWLRAALAAGG